MVNIPVDLKGFPKFPIAKKPRVAKKNSENVFFYENE